MFISTFRSENSVYIEDKGQVQDMGKTYNHEIKAHCQTREKKIG